MKASGKRKVSRASQPNIWTGKPRKWVCEDNLFTDLELQATEAMVAYQGRENEIPWNLKLTILARLEDRVIKLRGHMAHMKSLWKLKEDIADLAGGLTTAEQHYCEAEGIKPSDFLKAKRANTSK